MSEIFYKFLSEFRQDFLRNYFNNSCRSSTIYSYGFLPWMVPRIFPDIRIGTFPEICPGVSSGIGEPLSEWIKLRYTTIDHRNDCRGSTTGYACIKTPNTFFFSICLAVPILPIYVEIIETITMQKQISRLLFSETLLTNSLLLFYDSHTIFQNEDKTCSFLDMCKSNIKTNPNYYHLVSWKFLHIQNTAVLVKICNPFSGTWVGGIKRK